MDNSTSARPRSTLRGDPYRAYEALPPEVRRALQEALVDWCPLRAREWHLDLLRRQRLQPAQAASALVQTIRRQDQDEIGAFARAWRKTAREGAEAYPHLAAEATLQRYAGTAGIPAAEPVAPAAPAKEARPATQAKKTPLGSREKTARPAKPAKAWSASRADPRAAARPGKPTKARPKARPEAKRTSSKRRRARR